MGSNKCELCTRIFFGLILIVLGIATLACQSLFTHNNNNGSGGLVFGWSYHAGFVTGIALIFQGIMGATGSIAARITSGVVEVILIVTLILSAVQLFHNDKDRYRDEMLAIGRLLAKNQNAEGVTADEQVKFREFQTNELLRAYSEGLMGDGTPPPMLSTQRGPLPIPYEEYRRLEVAILSITVFGLILLPLSTVLARRYLKD